MMICSKLLQHWRLALLGAVAATVVLIAAQALPIRSQTDVLVNADQRTVGQPPPSPKAEKDRKTLPDGNHINISSLAPRSDALWSTSLASLTAAAERPIFNPTRRPAELTTASVPSPARQPVRPPPLVLIGAVDGEEAMAIFQNTVTKDIVRLRKGETYSSWVLRSVVGREATLQYGREHITLAVLPQPAKPNPAPKR
jgi:hypothetical protein